MHRNVTLKTPSGEVQLRYTFAAFFMLEERYGLSFAEAANVVSTGSGARLAQVVLCGLEGYRLKERSRPEEWTITEVVDLLEDVPLSRIQVAADRALERAAIEDDEAPKGDAPPPKE